MPFIAKQDKTKPEPVTFKIRPEVVAELKLYAAFLEGSEESYVVQEALREVFAKDKDFQKWKAENAAVPITRKPAKAGAA